MSTQLSLLPFFDEQKVLDKANTLIDMLNDGRPKKELYYAQWFYKQDGYWVFMAANKKKDALFNVLDDNGKIPENFSADWRIYQNVKREFNRLTKHL